ncbi:hypothetical protein JTB14_030506 [Gonioctena quinquepunctata]|nr:hypothetical protein JTB14_030506 [Gonioctena quinquepunctata]
MEKFFIKKEPELHYAQGCFRSNASAQSPTASLAGRPTSQKTRIAGSPNKPPKCLIRQQTKQKYITVVKDDNEAVTVKDYRGAEVTWIEGLIIKNSGKNTKFLN